MVNFKTYGQVDVALTGHHYSIHICRDGLNYPEVVRTIINSSQALIVTNQTIAPFYLERIRTALSDIQCDAVILEDGEQHKNQHSLSRIYDALIANRHHRDTTIVALGGGVIGDMAGFAAATYQRGVGLVQIPTTLLAQVDSSVGGKTAINHPQGKNLIGSFYQPQSVLIDLATLNTLPIREFRAGLAEVIKYSLLAGGDFFEKLYVDLEQGLTPDSPQLPELIAECCRIKARCVEVDEKETGRRVLLNLGHTFAHALEAYTHYRQWVHGEAVAIGLYCAAVMSNQMNLIDKTLVERIERMLRQAGLPHKIPKSVDLVQLRELMSLDKKVKNKNVRFVLIKKPGSCYLEAQVTEDCLQNTLIAAVEGE